MWYLKWNIYTAVDTIGELEEQQKIWKPKHTEKGRWKKLT